MPIEQPVQCAHCKNENLIHGLTLGRVNALMSNIGGPGQVPPNMGHQWAVYLCPNCSGVFPYRKFYGATSRQLQQQYEQLKNWCEERQADIADVRGIARKVEGMISSTKSLASLPTTTAIDELVNRAMIPLIERLEAQELKLNQRLIEIEAEQKRKKGGRPPKVRGGTP